MKIWECKIGEITEQQFNLLNAPDWPLRQAIEEAYFSLTGKYPEFIFSGWGATLSTGERAVVNNE